MKKLFALSLKNNFMKKFLLFLINLIGISFYAHALIISEIMYDPQGSDTSREWVEVYNDTQSDINLSTWKFFESGTNHSLAPSQGGATVPVNGYAVIADNPAKFLLDYPTFSGILFDSSFLLANTGEHLAVKETSTGPEISPVDYNPALGGNDDGSTLSFISGAWTRGEATPGLENKASILIVSTSTSATTTENQATVAQMSPPTSDIVFYLPFEKTVVAGADAEFNTYAMTRGGKNIDNLICNWSFGDGGRATGTSTKYIYAYPGKYIAQVEGANSYVAGTGRINVRVVTPDIFIEKIGAGKYGTYIDIKNPNTYELDLSQWKLLINEQTFPFPKNTLIAGNTTTHFSGLAMGFASTTISASTTVKILFPNLEEVTRYSVSSDIVNVISTSAISNLNFAKPMVLGVSTTTVSSLRLSVLSSQRTLGSSVSIKTNSKEIKPEVTTTSSSTIKIVTNKTENKNTSIANWLKKFFGF